MIAPQSVGVVVPQRAEFTTPLALRSGGTLDNYHLIYETYGSLNAEAAKKGLEIFAEHSEDERANPGKHPNIARLLQIEAGAPALRVKHVFAV